MDLVVFLNKWVHLVSVVATVGAIIAMRFIVLPALQPNDDGEESAATQAVNRRFGIVTAVTWLLVLITGFVNYFMVSPKVNKTYHMLLGMKITLALIMFALAIGLSHPAPAFARLQRGRSQWLLILSLIGLVVIGLSAHLNISRITGAGLDKGIPPAAAQPASVAP